MFLWWLSWSWAEDNCGGPMVIRKILPLHEASDVPINSQIFVALAGNGNADHMRILVRENIGGLPVEFDLQTACYAHESDTEYHCNYELKPYQDLKEHKEYQISLSGTELHAEGCFGYSTTFTTGHSRIELDTAPPTLEIVGYMPRPEDAVGDCDWQDAMKYELSVQVQDPDMERISIIHAYEVDPESCQEELVHSVFPIAGIDFFDFHQVLKPSTEGERCYRAEHMDWAGNRTESSPTICWDMDNNVGVPFYGCSEDGEPVVPDENDTEDNVVENDTGIDSEEAPSGGFSSEVVVQTDGGCAGGLIFIPFLFHRRRRR
ncbi:MAG: hypothetical protein VX278_06635 [Myxococcota bacterium]|nr:hypothetical protein [Myxococcota bacterium]